MAAERVDAGGGKVPDGWAGLVTEYGHDLSGRRPRPRAQGASAKAPETFSANTATGRTPSLPQTLTLEPRGDTPAWELSDSDLKERRTGPAERRVSEPNPLFADKDRRIGEPDRRAPATPETGEA